MGCGKIMHGNEEDGEICCGDARGHYNQNGKWVYDGDWTCDFCQVELDKLKTQKILKKMEKNKQFEEIWKMYPQYKDVETINKMMKEVETDCCNELLIAFNIESVPSNVDTFEKVIIYIKSKLISQRKE